jgi:hypothetical protein
VAVDLSVAFPVEPELAFPMVPEGPFGEVGCDPPSGVACAELAAKSRTPAASPPVHRVLVNLPMRGDSFRSLVVPIWHRIGAALTRIRSGWLTLRGRRSSPRTERRDDNPSRVRPALTEGQLLERSSKVCPTTTESQRDSSMACAGLTRRDGDGHRAGHNRPTRGEDTAEQKVRAPCPRTLAEPGGR